MCSIESYRQCYILVINTPDLAWYTIHFLCALKIFSTFDGSSQYWAILCSSYDVFTWLRIVVEYNNSDYT